MKAKIPRAPSVLEETFALLIRIAGLPPPVREFSFAPDRKWRVDFAWPPAMLLVELEGGVFSGGRHTRGSGFEADAEKYNAATLLGYSVLRFTMRGIKNGTAIAQVEAFLQRAGQYADLFSPNTAIVSPNDGAPAVASFTPSQPLPTP